MYHFILGRFTVIYRTAECRKKSEEKIKWDQDVNQVRLKPTALICHVHNYARALANFKFVTLVCKYFYRPLLRLECRKQHKKI